MSGDSERAGRGNTDRTVRILVPVTAAILVPVTAAILVPVYVEADESIDLEALRSSANERGEVTEIGEFAEAAAQAALNSDEVVLAIDALLSGVYTFRREHPQARAMINPFLGIATDQEV